MIYTVTTFVLFVLYLFLTISWVQFLLPQATRVKTVLRRARVAFAKRRRAGDGVPLDAWGRPEDDQAVIVVASWVYVGSGYETEGERWLALSAAARAREQRRIAREELTTTTASAVAA